MKEVTCNKCGWVHFIPPVNYIEMVTETLRMEHCFNCGNSYKDFRPAVEADAPEGVTLQPILGYENETNKT